MLCVRVMRMCHSLPHFRLVLAEAQYKFANTVLHNTTSPFRGFRNHVLVVVEYTRSHCPRDGVMMLHHT